MYAIKRSDGLYLCDGPVYVDRKTPPPVWQGIEGIRELYLETSLWNITMRKERIEKTYLAYEIKVARLSDEELEYLSFRKLRGH